MQIRNVSGSLNSGDFWLTPAANKTWRILAVPPATNSQALFCDIDVNTKT